MKNKNKIGFIGSYSSANFGDWAMLVNNIYDLECEDAVVFTYNSRFPKVALDEYCSRVNVKYIEVQLKEDGELYTGNGNTEKLFSTPFEALKRLKNSKELYQTISDIDVLIVSGGGWINHFWAERIEKLYKIMIPIYIASQLGKKISFTANGVGPFDDSREIFRYFFGYIRNTKIAIRDNLYSMSHLKEVGVNSKNVSYIPDDLYLINQKLLDKEIHRKIEQKNYIVVEMFYPLEKLKQYEQRLIEFSNNINRKYGLSIVLLPFDLVHYGLEQAKYLHSILKNTEIYSIDSTGYLPIQDAYRIIKNAKLMITSRYHGLVLSLSSETPVIFRLVNKMGDIRYSYNKGLGMLKTAFDGIRFDEFDFLNDNLIDILDSVENSFEDIVMEQKKIYSMEKYKENKIRLKDLRKNYLKDILTK